MILNNNKMVLLYGFNNEEIEILKTIIKKNSNAVIKNVTKPMLNMKIKDIISGLIIETYTKNALEEKAIVFNSFSDEELDRTILALRKETTLKPILAVVTPTSSEWTFNHLLGELIKEREWFKKSKKKNKR